MEYCSIATPGDDLFVQCYEGICADRNDGSSAVGSEDHYKSVFATLQFDSAFEKVGPAVQWTRWGSWYNRMKTFLRQWHERLLILSTTALRLGFYRDVRDLPLWGNVMLGGSGAPRPSSGGAVASSSAPPSSSGAPSSSSAASGLAAAGSPSAPSASVGPAAPGPSGGKRAGAAARESQEVCALREMCANGLRLVTQILGNPATNQKAKIWVVASDPAW